MKEIDEESFKKLELKLLSNFKQFCDENNLTYYLAYGSLLGAVRHKGFIPWDDDIDITMPRNDYEKMIKILKTQKKDFTIFSYNDPVTYNHYFAKVSDKESQLESKYMKDIAGLGVFIDVFPMDTLYLSKKHQKQLVHKIKRIINMIEINCMQSYWPSTNFIKNLIKYFIYVYAKFKGIEYWMKKYEHLINYYSEIRDTEKKQYLFAYDILNEDIFIPKIDLEFEGEKYSCPNNYNIYLTSIYGDYKTLPPLEKQIANHDFKTYYK